MPTITGIVGLVIGIAAAVGTSDPMTSAQYKTVAGQLSTAQAARDDAQGKVDAATKRAADAEAAAKTSQDAVAARERAVATKESAVALREQVVGATEQRIAATTITEGTWTVGVDIEPGTYRTKTAVGTTCYWGIYKSGTNGDDIIQNDVVTGGIPTVKLSAGQDFKTSRCGDWIKQ